MPTHYHYDSAGRLIGESDATGQVLHEIVAVTGTAANDNRLIRTFTDMQSLVSSND